MNSPCFNRFTAIVIEMWKEKKRKPSNLCVSLAFGRVCSDQLNFCHQQLVHEAGTDFSCSTFMKRHNICQWNETRVVVEAATFILLPLITSVRQKETLPLLLHSQLYRGKHLLPVSFVSINSTPVDLCNWRRRKKSISKVTSTTATTTTTTNNTKFPYNYII